MATQQRAEPIRTWMADTRAEALAADAHRQSVAVAASDYAVDDQDFIDALSIDVFT